MNTQTGDIFIGDEKTRAANFGVPLQPAEARQLRAVDSVQERLRRYKQAHRNDVCPREECRRTLRHHSLAEWQHCAAVASHGDLVKYLDGLKPARRKAEITKVGTVDAEGICHGWEFDGHDDGAGVEFAKDGVYVGGYLIAELRAIAKAR